MSLHDRILDFIKKLNLERNTKIKADTSLIKSGLIDSLSLLHLAEWIEQQVDTHVDLTKFDLSKEWDTIADIGGFIERHRSGNILACCKQDQNQKSSI